MTAQVRQPQRRPSTSIPWVAFVATVAVIFFAVAGGGCQASRGGGRASADATGAEMRAEAMAAADVYTTTVVQALDELRETTARPEVARWTLLHKITTATAAFTNATQSSDGGSLLDMLVLATLKRRAVEEHWVPTFLHEEGKALLAAHVRAENDVWAAGSKMLTRRQLEELKTIIEQWREDHPQQYYVSHIRLADIAASRNLTRQSSQVKLPGSVFGLLYLDPLSGLDPVAAELRSYRALTERMVYLAQRMPLVFVAQVERATNDATGAPEVRRMVNAAEKLNETFSRFADTASRFPQQLSAERTAAIEQASAAVAAERKAVLTELETQGAQMQRLIGDARVLLDRADQAGASIGKSTAETVLAAERSTLRTLNHAFWLMLMLILVLLVGIPCSAILYRHGRQGSARRLLRPRSQNVPVRDLVTGDHELDPKGTDSA